MMRNTRRFNARGHMMLAIIDGIHRAATAVARALRAVRARLTAFVRNRALAP